MINVCNDDFGALLGKQASCFLTNALPAARHDGDLADEQAAGVIELVDELVDAVGHFGICAAAAAGIQKEENVEIEEDVVKRKSKLPDLGEMMEMAWATEVPRKNR